SDSYIGAEILGDYYDKHHLNNDLIKNAIQCNIRQDELDHMKAATNKTPEEQELYNSAQKNHNASVDERKNKGATVLLTITQHSTTEFDAYLMKARITSMKGKKTDQYSFAPTRHQLKMDVLNAAEKLLSKDGWNNDNYGGFLIAQKQYNESFKNPNSSWLSSATSAPQATPVNQQEIIKMLEQSSHKTDKLLAQLYPLVDKLAEIKSADKQPTFVAKK
ncbi:MAG: hypothetical protein ABSF18_04860, partial [Gammaproteobacteria bacterium]